MAEKLLSLLSKAAKPSNLSDSSDEDSVIDSTASGNEVLAVKPSSESESATEPTKASLDDSQNDWYFTSNKAIPSRHNIMFNRVPAKKARPTDSTKGTHETPLIKVEQESSNNKMCIDIDHPPSSKPYPSMAPIDAVVHINIDEMGGKRLLDFDLRTMIQQHGFVPNTVFEDFVKQLVPECFVMHTNRANSHFLWNL
jgi:hypothetical protein